MRARALAPPAWPPHRATANRPASSTHTTAGIGGLVGQQGGDDADGGAGGQEQHEGVDARPPVAHDVGHAAVGVLVREPAARARPASVTDDGVERPLIRRGPHATNTGFSAASRRPPSGRTWPRDTPTCTRWPRRAAAPAARSRAAKVATTRPPGASRARTASSTSRPPPPTKARSGSGRPASAAGRLALDHLDVDAVGCRVLPGPLGLVGARARRRSPAGPAAAGRTRRPRCRCPLRRPTARRPGAGPACPGPRPAPRPW